MKTTHSSTGLRVMYSHSRVVRGRDVLTAWALRLASRGHRTLPSTLIATCMLQTRAIMRFAASALTAWSAR